MKHLYYPIYCRGGSGLSNLIMSFEIGALAAALLDRTLVVEGNIAPPANLVTYGDPRIDTQPRAKIPDLINVPVSWMNAEDLDQDLDTAYVMAQGNVSDAIFVWPPGSDIGTRDFHDFARGRQVVVTETIESRAEQIVRLFPSSADGHSLENLGFYSYFYYVDEATRRLLHDLLRNMRAKNPYAKLAARVSADLGAFNAVHVRRGDFKQTFGVTTLNRTPEEAIRRLDANFDRDTTLLILTDERADPFFDKITAHFTNCVFVDHHVLENYSDEFFGLPQHDCITLAYLSQLIAGDSIDFVGTMTSTFTSMVQRLRGNRGKQEQFKFLWNEIPDPGVAVTERGTHPPSDCVPLHADGRLVEEYLGPYTWNRINARINPAWQREWPESFLTAPDFDDESTTSSRPGTCSMAVSCEVRSRNDGQGVAAAVTESGQIRKTDGLQHNQAMQASSSTDVEVTVHLVDGQRIQTVLSSDSAILRELHLALAAGTDSVPDRGPVLLQLPIDEGQRAYSFSSEHLLSVETSPPVLLDTSVLKEQALARHEEFKPLLPESGLVDALSSPENADASEPSAALEQPAPVPARTPPIVRQVHWPAVDGDVARVDFEPLPFVQVVDFLTPDEQLALIDDPGISAASGGAGDEHYSGELPWVLDSRFADRFAQRVRLLLPAMLPSFDPSRALDLGRLEVAGHGDGDSMDAEIARAVSATPREITCRYFFHREPKSYTGGELQLRRDDKVHLVAPRNNALLIHPTSALDGVRPLRSSGEAAGSILFAIALRIQ